MYRFKKGCYGNHSNESSNCQKFIEDKNCQNGIKETCKKEDMILTEILLYELCASVKLTEDMEKAKKFKLRAKLWDFFGSQCFI